MGESFPASGKLEAIRCVILSNLFHPLFPAFRTWIAQYWSPHTPRHTLGSPDEIQDFYIEKFALYSLCNSDHNETSDEDNESDMGQVGQVSRSITKRRAVPENTLTEIQYRSALSSNPGSLSNHHFPHSSQSGGFVSLDFSGTEAFQSKHLRNTEDNIQ